MDYLSGFTMKRITDALFLCGSRASFPFTAAMHVFADNPVDASSLSEEGWQGVSDVVSVFAVLNDWWENENVYRLLDGTVCVVGRSRLLINQSISICRADWRSAIPERVGQQCYHPCRLHSIITTRKNQNWVRPNLCIVSSTCVFWDR